MSTTPESLFEKYVLPIVERELDALNKYSVRRTLDQERATLLVKYTRACVAIRDSDTRAKSSTKSNGVEEMTTEQLLALASELLAKQGYDTAQLRDVLSGHKERQ